MKLRTSSVIESPADVKLDIPIGFDEVVSMISSRDRRSGDDNKTATDRARARLKYAIGKGSILRRSAGLCRYHVYAWLQQKWPGMFEDLPKVWIGDVTLPLVVTITERPPACPESLDAAHALLISMHEEIQKLKATIKDLEPDARAFRSIKLKNAANGKRGGRPPAANKR
jgi:hypothetical protein